MSKSFYKVYIACMTKRPDGNPVRDYVLAKELYRKLEQKGIHTFLMNKCNPDDRTEALDSASVLIIAGTTAASLASDEVRNDYEDFIAGVELSGKRKWRVFIYLRGITRESLPGYLGAHRSYDYFDTDGLVQKIESTLEKKEPKYFVFDVDDDNKQDSFGDLPESLPDCAESVREYDDDDHPVSRPRRARRAPQEYSDEIRIEEDVQPEPEPELSEETASTTPQEPAPPSPLTPFPPLSEPEKKPVKVKPAKVSKVEFSVVAPDEVKPGKSSVIDLLMYTRNQKAIVRRTIDQAKEKSSEAARSSGSVSVRQGSCVTALLFSDDMITRLYFTVPIGSKKKVTVRFTRKDCRKAFVSYSHKDRLRVAEQLLAIQEVAPKLRFWMDNRSMSAGDMWRNAIASAIRNADVFLLFWSVSARDSSEVRKEWEYALKLEQSDKRRSKRVKSGTRFISPVPLDSPSDCPPPKELSDLHFGDPSFDSDIENIEKVKFWAVKRKNIKFL